MWFLQLRNTHKQFFILVLLVSIAHIALLLGLFFVYQDVAHHLDLTIMPSMMHREIEFRVAIEKGAPGKTGGMQKTLAKTTAPAKKMAAKSTLIVTQQAKPAKNTKPVPQKVAAKKKEVAKASPVAEKPFDKLRANGEKKVVAKTEEKKVVEKIEVPKIEPIAKAPEQAAAAVSSNALAIDLSNDSQLAFFQAEYKALYENLSDQWAPPAGIPAESQCIITVIVDRQGELDDMIVDKSSGMLVFDLAARSAVSELEFPRFVWGKSITITFSV